MAAPKLRVGIVDYLNAWPLAWGFLAGALDARYEAIYLPPAKVAEDLRSGRLEVGLIPSIEVQRIPDLEVVPGLCVAATHEVRSVILVSRCPMEEIRSVALDRNSRTSAALVQIVLQASNGALPRVALSRPDTEAMLQHADAALIIGDPALHVDRARYRVWDLAAEWRQLTGLPFVFAVWALRGAAAERAGGLADDLSASLEMGLNGIEDVVERATAQLGLPAAEVRRYLKRHLTFRLDDRGLAGLREFYARAAALGLIAPPSALRFVAS